MGIAGGTTGRRRRRGSAAATVCACAGALAAAPTLGATKAGTAITNIATLTSGKGAQIASNPVTLTTAEMLDVTVTADQPTLGADTTLIPVGFSIANRGNGQEDFALAATADRREASRIAIDADGDGRYDAANDRLLAAHSSLPLAPGERVRVFVLVEGDGLPADAQITLTATARTGSGAPGTVFDGRGDGGGDAVVGTTGASATATTRLVAAATLPGLIKSQAVFAPDGGARAVRGAIITYTLAASFPAATQGAVIDDPVPAGTAYVAGSMTLDGRALSDAADGDGGSFDAGGIHVRLGDVTAASTRTVQFSVKIQ